MIPGDPTVWLAKDPKDPPHPVFTASTRLALSVTVRNEPPAQQKPSLYGVTATLTDFPTHAASDGKGISAEADSDP